MVDADSRDVLPHDTDAIERLVLHQCERCGRDYPGFEIVLRPVRRRHFIGRCGDCAQQFDIAPGERLPKRTSVIRKPVPPRPNRPSPDVAAAIARQLESMRHEPMARQCVVVGSDGTISDRIWWSVELPTVRPWERRIEPRRVEPWTGRAVIEMWSNEP